MRRTTPSRYSSLMEEEPENSANLSLIFCNSLLVAIFLTAFIANLLVLVVFYKKSGLRSTANRFVVNLMSINLLSCTLLLPLSLADNAITSSNKVLCVATELSSVFCSSVIIYAVLLIALDQYCAVEDPLHYHHIISSSKSNLMIISSWCLSAVFTVMDGVQPSIDKGEYSVFRHCGLGSPSNSSSPSESGSLFSTDNAKIYRYVFCTVYAFSVFVIPFLLICFIYYRICVAASGNTKRTRTGRTSHEDTGRGECNEKEEYFVIVNNVQKKAPAGHLESCSLLGKDTGRPSFVVTRPSPPKSTPAEKADPKERSETPFLKPTLKSNSSFSKLSSVHIQFSSETRGDERPPRRHSNTPLPVLDPEFENISKSRSPSVYSNGEVPALSSTTSRSSSMNSTRHSASRASSIRSTSSYIVHNIRRRLSNASLFRYREEARAARISALVIVMALVCWLPFFTIFYLHSGTQMEVISGRRTFPLYFDSFSIAFLLLSAVISPFLFAFRNKKIKKEIRKILKCWGEEARADCAKSFYKYNLSVDVKSHREPIFVDLDKKAVPAQLHFSLENIHIPQDMPPSVASP